MTRRNPRYGAAHDKKRRIEARKVAAGTARCARCGGPILPGTSWHLDHAEGGGYLGPAHAFCNTSAGGKKRAAQLYGQAVVTGRPADHPGVTMWSRCWLPTDDGRPCGRGLCHECRGVQAA